MLHCTSTLVAVRATLLLSTLITAYPLPREPLNLYGDLLSKQDPQQPLPQRATEDQLKWQPSLDFDTDGCYNTPAIFANGKVAEGLSNDGTGGADGCRDPSDLENNNVYVRTRCNNGWCAHLYDYYFEKDVAVQHVSDPGGHRHDWEHIAVFVQDGELKAVAASKHGHYKTRSVNDVRMDGNHPKIVYNKNGGSTHSFRFGREDDDNIENASGAWFRGALVDYDTGFPGNTRDILMTHDFGRASIAIKDDSFQWNLDHARHGLTPGFDPGVDS
ncbi:necrosis inducing protein-domain-containing protein [Hypoxylon cercidicola]|nr:necrosis inducing protein-domain-containing protein [Hypoxylon cercidicola]